MSDEAGWDVDGIRATRRHAAHYQLSGLTMGDEWLEGDGPTEAAPAVAIPVAVIIALLHARGYLVAPVPPDLAAKVTRAAEVAGQSVGDFVRDAVVARVLLVADGGSRG